MSLSRRRVIAHRGGANEAPENTLSAIRRSLELGVGAVELDVRLTADDRVVVVHDATVPDFSVALTVGVVEELTWAELQSVNVGTAENPESPPLLSDILELAWNENCLLMIELKTSSRDADLVREVVKLVQASGRIDSVLCGSFEPCIMDWLHAACPSLKLVAIAYTDEMIERHGGVPFDLWALSRPMALGSARLAASVRPVPLWCWTVNEPDHLPELAGVGVVGFITDCPTRLSDALFGDSKTI